MKDLISALFIFGIIVIYFIPVIVAGVRNHKSFGGVIVMNLFLGWTFIGWVLALIRALESKQK